MPRFLLIALFTLLATPLASFAACSSPSGDEGDVIYSSTAKMLQFCNGTVWVNAAGVAPSSGGSSSGGGGSTLYYAGTKIGPIVSSSSANNNNTGSLYVFADGIGVIVNATLSNQSIYGPNISATAYFSEPDCEGHLLGSDSNNYYAYACSGAESCTTGVFLGANYQINTPVKARRFSGGNCSNYTNTINIYPPYLYCRQSNNYICEIR